MIEYRASQYLNVIGLGKTSLLFNGMNGCLDEVPVKLAEMLKAGGRVSLAALNPEDTQVLLKRGCPVQFNLRCFTA